jgi:hypothetical protein
MKSNFGEKSKIFTNVVSKDAVPSLIQTLTHRVHGCVFVRPEVRIKDELATADSFIAVTDAIVFDSEGNEIFKTGFMVVNREHIVWLIPDEDLINDDNPGEAG